MNKHSETTRSYTDLMQRITFLKDLGLAGGFQHG